MRISGFGLFSIEILRCAQDNLFERYYAITVFFFYQLLEIILTFNLPDKNTITVQITNAVIHFV